jgi:ABC-type transporter Mla MlaB component
MAIALRRRGSYEIMLRVSVIQAGKAVRFCLEGRLVRPWVEELAGECDRAVAQGKTLTLDLAQVSFISLEGVALLRRLAALSVRVVNCTPFVAEQLKEALTC